MFHRAAPDVLFTAYSLLSELLGPGHSTRTAPVDPFSASTMDPVVVRKIVPSIVGADVMGYPVASFHSRPPRAPTYGDRPVSCASWL